MYTELKLLVNSSASTVTGELSGGATECCAPEILGNVASKTVLCKLAEELAVFAAARLVGLIDNPSFCTVVLELSSTFVCAELGLVEDIVTPSSGIVA